MAAPDLTGRTFGRLTVLGRAGSAPTGKALWRCACSCGGETVTKTHYLLSGETRSCGCLHRELAAAKGRLKKANLLGQTFGRLTVRAAAPTAGGKGEARWICDCSCGRTYAAVGTRMVNGICLSCGCLRDELMRARAAAVGSARRIKACRTCGRIYTATGPQKECSADCRAKWHAADEARRREEKRLIELAADASELAAELERRLTRGQATLGPDHPDD